MAAHHGWAKAEDGTLRAVGVWVPSWTDGYGTISIERQPTINRRDWKYCFGRLLGAAKAVQECVKGKKEIAHTGRRPSPLFCLLSAQIVCSRFVEAHCDQLRLVRTSLPTPPEYSSLIGRPYCEFVIDSILGWWNYLYIFVQHDDESIRLRGRKQIAFETQQVVLRWNEVLHSASNRFAIDFDVLARLVLMEIDSCHWMADEDTGTVAPAMVEKYHEKASLSDPAPSWDKKALRLLIDSKEYSFAPQAKAVFKLLDLFQEKGWAKTVECADAELVGRSLRTLRGRSELPISFHRNGKAFEWRRKPKETTAELPLNYR